MKRRIYIFLSFLFVILFSISSIRAMDNNTSNNDFEKHILEEYKKGNTMDDSFVQARRNKAVQFDLLKFCDEQYFLTDLFYENYSYSYLMESGRIILDRYQAGYKDKNRNLVNYAQYSIIDQSNHTFKNAAGDSLMNGIWRLSNNHLAFCAQGLMASPSVGDLTSEPYLVDNEALRKALYYGYGGPGDILSARYGVSGAIVLTDDLVSNAYSGTCIAKEALNGRFWNQILSSLWNEIMAKPAVKNYAAYMVHVEGKANNWQGVYSLKQNLAYGVYVPKGSIKILKKSSLETISNQNKMYSLKGAQYALYEDKECKYEVGVFTINENGYSNTISDLDIKNYYVKEILPPHGYQKDTTIYTVSVKENETVELSVKDNPQTNIVSLALIKQDSDKGNVAQGLATLKDGQFCFKFYGGSYTSDPAEQGILPLRSWILKTDKNGEIYLKDDYKVSGDDFYTDHEGNIVLPIGTITVQEILAPQGYRLNNTVYTQFLDAKESSNIHFSQFKVFNVKDDVVRLKIYKVQEQTQIPLSNVTFKHKAPNLPFVRKVTTNENGEIELVGLVRGKHILTEFQTQDGYVLDTNPIEIEVSEDGKIQSSVVEIKDNTIRIENKVNPYTLRIHKKDGNNLLLDNAVFGLFKDKDCLEKIDEQISVSGLVEFKNLKNKEKYYVKELKAPAGYQKDESVYEIYTDLIPCQNQNDVYLNQTKYTNMYDDGNVNMDLVNNRMMKLPHTGSVQNLCLVGSGILLMIITIKRKKYEK